MSEPKTSTDEILVHLVRPGGEARDYHLAEGATLADLLRLSGVPPTGDRAVLVDGAPTEEALPLREGVVVTVIPGPGDAPAVEPWRAAVPAFGDDTLFEEYQEALRERRREMDPDEGRGG